ncbi:pyridoxamine 5'-phosphate oxidase family protein [Sphaerisporangium viridialbum]|uniref:pyridoxamine 5'-phosphate oxidase family protein n=1 Tax=Sphaerisporangium viridialbum TaxID=46189 RepID=UPI003C744814
MGRTQHRGLPVSTAFLSEPRVASLTTLRPDGSPHVVAVRFTWDGRAALARVLTVARARASPDLMIASRRTGGSPCRA